MKHGEWDCLANRQMAARGGGAVKQSVENERRRARMSIGVEYLYPRELVLGSKLAGIAPDWRPTDLMC